LNLAKTFDVLDIHFGSTRHHDLKPKTSQSFSDELNRMVFSIVHRVIEVTSITIPRNVHFIDGWAFFDISKTPGGLPQDRDQIEAPGGVRKVRSALQLKNRCYGALLRRLRAATSETDAMMATTDHTRAFFCQRSGHRRRGVATTMAI
jgi:hypothetical protein